MNSNRKNLSLDIYIEHIENLGYWGFPVRKYAQWANITAKLAMHDVQIAVKENKLSKMVQDLYYNKESKNLSPYVLEDMITFFRPNNFNYVSFEKILHQYGVIYEYVFSLTVATTGASGSYMTDQGVIQFTHVDVDDMHRLQHRLFWDKQRLCYIATPLQAWEDLKAADRNLDIVDMYRLDKAIKDYPEDINYYFDDAYFYGNATSLLR